MALQRWRSLRSWLERAARLSGAAETLRASSRMPIWPAERFELERQTQQLGARLPAPIGRRLQQEGQALSIDQAIAYALADDAATSTHTPSPLARLSAREREIATLIAQGATNRAIAETLVISERTVERHVANIFAKLDVGSRTRIAALAVEAGLLQQRA